jgi:hypothetical protein
MLCLRDVMESAERNAFSVGKHFIESVYSGDETFFPSIAAEQS